MVPGGGGGGGLTISLSCHNARNICHSEERFSVLESHSHALSDDIFGGLKLENFIPHFCDVIKYDVTISRHVSKAVCKVW